MSVQKLDILNFYSIFRSTIHPLFWVCDVRAAVCFDMICFDLIFGHLECRSRNLFFHICSKLGMRKVVTFDHSTAVAFLYHPCLCTPRLIPLGTGIYNELPCIGYVKNLNNPVRNRLSFSKCKEVVWPWYICHQEFQFTSSSSEILLP